MLRPLLVYGAYGYTGELIARHASQRGLAPALAGRDGDRLQPLARELGCDARPFALDDPDEARHGIAGAGVVLNCAGPFDNTFEPLARACISTGAHYVDITGEIPVFEAARALGPAAARAGVMLLPGAGFDVVPTDCLASHLARRLPGARRIVLALSALGRLSRGTARTAMAQSHLRPADTARHPPARAFDFGEGPVSCVSIPWGDLVTAPRSTGIEDVAVYLAAPAGRRALLHAMPLLAPVLRLPAIGSVAAALLTGGSRGPDESERASGRTLLYGEAVDATGRVVAARQRHGEAYAFTALSAVEIASRAMRDEVIPGWQTPASAYGPDLALQVGGVRF